ETDKPVYGLTKNVHSYHLAKVIFHEWSHIFKDIMKPVSLSHKLRYLFAPPGWSHDGSSKTSAQLREEMKK
ncbi:MAG TPA: sterol desaturase family protein, partial [Bacteroidia bacterium]|nr:sterol desaturase family protein [Bacteroidia bacterium]